MSHLLLLLETPDPLKEHHSTTLPSLFYFIKYYYVLNKLSLFICMSVLSECRSVLPVSGLSVEDIRSL